MYTDKLYTHFQDSHYGTDDMDAFWFLEEGGLGQWSRQIPVNGFDLLTQLTEGNLQKTGVPEFTAKEAMKKIELSLELGRPTGFFLMFLLMSCFLNVVPFFGTRSGNSGGYGKTNRSNTQEWAGEHPKISEYIRSPQDILWTAARLRQGLWAQVEPPRRELALDTVAEIGIKG